MDCRPFRGLEDRLSPRKSSRPGIPLSQLAISSGGSGIGPDESFDPSAHRDPDRIDDLPAVPVLLVRNNLVADPAQGQWLDSRRPIGHPLRGLLVSEFVGAFILG